MSKFTGGRRARDCGSVLIIVLWVAFGLVSLALYFANAMSFEFRAADNRVTAVEAGQAIDGAARYVSNILAAVEIPGTLPDLETYLFEEVAVGDATFWFIGRDTNVMQNGPTELTFGLVDEASKLNLNTVTADMLTNLPRMTLELAAAIVDWRDEDSDAGELGGAEEEMYELLSPAYQCKNAPFESIDELRLVYGMDLETLYGEDSNLNGVLDPNENDGEDSPPNDNRDGKLDPGVLEYVTVWSRESNSAYTNVNDTAALQPLLEEKLGSDRATPILAIFAGNSNPNQQGQQGQQNSPATTFPNLMEFYLQAKARANLTEDEFAQIADYICASTNSNPDSYSEGLININTASEAVLGCIPGIGTNNASAVVAYRESNAGNLGSVAWLVNALDEEAAQQAGPYVTTHSFQVCADIAAVGRYGRGYRRMKYVFDTSEGAPKILYRQELTHLGWALGPDARNNLLATESTRIR